MAYRLLLPCFDASPETKLDAVMTELNARQTGDCPVRWRIEDLPGEYAQAERAQLCVSLLGVSRVDQEAGDNYFHIPRGTDSWIEVRISGGGVNRQLRLHARLIALKIAERLALPVVETRNGVYCRTPAAFGAWCAREPHAQTIRLAQIEHVTEPPHWSPEPLCPPAGAAIARKALARLPRRGLFTRARHRLGRRRAYVVSLPAFEDSAVVSALVAEVFRTFGRGYVVHEPEHHRLVIYGKQNHSTQQMIGYFRIRAHPKKADLVAAYSGL